MYLNYCWSEQTFNRSHLSMLWWLSSRPLSTLTIPDPWGICRGGELGLLCHTQRCKWTRWLSFPVRKWRSSWFFGRKRLWWFEWLEWFKWLKRFQLTFRSSGASTSCCKDKKIFQCLLLAWNNIILSMLLEQYQPLPLNTFTHVHTG